MNTQINTIFQDSIFKEKKNLKPIYEYLDFDHWDLKVMNYNFDHRHKVNVFLTWKDMVLRHVVFLVRGIQTVEKNGSLSRKAINVIDKRFYKHNINNYLGTLEDINIIDRLKLSSVLRYEFKKKLKQSYQLSFLEDVSYFKIQTSQQIYFDMNATISTSFDVKTSDIHINYQHRSDSIDSSWSDIISAGDLEDSNRNRYLSIFGILMDIDKFFERHQVAIIK